MKLLGKILGIFAWILLILLLICLFSFISFVMGWPLVTGVVIVLGIAGVVLLFFVFRVLWRWRDKRKFVKQVIQDQKETENVSLSQANQQLKKIWNQKGKNFNSSYVGSKGKLISSMPLFLSLETGQQQKKIFHSFSTPIPNDENSPLAWHLLSSSAVLRVPFERNSEEEWAEMLSLMLKDRRELPFNGILLVVSYEELVAKEEESLVSFGQILRSRVQQICMTMNICFPVYLLIHGLDDIEGMPELLQLVGHSFDAEALGLDFVGNENGKGKLVLQAVVRSLEKGLQRSAVDTALPKGNMLRSLHSLLTFSKKLDLVIEPLCRELSRQITPMLCGIYFCASRPSHAGANPAFLSEFLNHVLPKALKIKHVSKIYPLRPKMALIALFGWLFLTLFICGLLSVNTLYQYHVLSTDSLKINVSSKVQRTQFYKQMLYAKRIEKARKAWLLPSLGQDMLLRVERKIKEQYIQNIYRNILSPMFASFREVVANRSESIDKNIKSDVAQELLWLCSCLVDKMNGENIDKNVNYPLTKFNENRWNPFYGEMIVNCLEWIDSKEQIKIISKNINSLLVEGLVNNKSGDIFDNIINSINTTHSNLNISVSQFWNHMSIGDKGDAIVPAGYTPKGYEMISSAIEDLHSIIGYDTPFETHINKFKEMYFQRYNEYWKNFIIAFTNVGVNIQQSSIFRKYAENKNIKELPYIQFLSNLVSFMQPVRDANMVSPWVKNIFKFGCVLDAAIDTWKPLSHNKSNIVFSFLARQKTNFLERFRDETTSAQDFREALAAVEDLNIFFNELLVLLETMENQDKSLGLAKIHYGGREGEQSVDESIFRKAQKALEKALYPFHIVKGSACDQLMNGILEFFAQGITVQAAQSLQKDWEQNVLGSPAALYEQEKGENDVFVEKGTVMTFLKSKLKPFLNYKNKKYVAANWKSITFPFTADLLTALNQAELYTSTKPLKENSDVMLRSQPTLVNVEARERPEETVLTLQCQGKAYQLVNRNYPHMEGFQYTDGQCGKTLLSIRFPSFSLHKQYPDFIEFLREFEYGEKIFAPTDFPNEAEKMDNVEVKSVTVRILPDNVNAILKVKDTLPPVIPDRITYVW